MDTNKTMPLYGANNWIWIDERHPLPAYLPDECFVCGKGGDVIKLVMDNDNKSFIEACDWLVEQFHIVLIDDAPVKTNTDRTDKTNKNESVSSEQSVVEKKEISAISAISAGPQKSVSSEQSVVEKKEISDISLISAGPQTTLVLLDADLVSRSLSLDSVFCNRKTVINNSPLQLNPESQGRIMRHAT